MTRIEAGDERGPKELLRVVSLRKGRLNPAEFRLRIGERGLSMSQVLSLGTTETKSAISALFENAPPVLVEVRFPNSGTSPDWYLCEEEEQLEQILERLGPGVELHLNSVWALRNVKGEICLKK